MLPNQPLTDALLFAVMTHLVAALGAQDKVVVLDPVLITAWFRLAAKSTTSTSSSSGSTSAYSTATHDVTTPPASAANLTSAQTKLLSQLLRHLTASTTSVLVIWHVGTFHWRLVFSSSPLGTLSVFDSARTPRNANAAAEFPDLDGLFQAISWFAGAGGNGLRGIVWRPARLQRSVQQKPGSVDCGVYVLRNAATILRQMSPVVVGSGVGNRYTEIETRH